MTPAKVKNDYKLHLHHSTSLIKGFHWWKLQLHITSATLEIARWSVTITINYWEYILCGFLNESLSHAQKVPVDIILISNCFQRKLVNQGKVLFSRNILELQEKILKWAGGCTHSHQSQQWVKRRNFITTFCNYWLYFSVGALRSQYLYKCKKKTFKTYTTNKNLDMKFLFYLIKNSQGTFSIYLV